MTDREMLELAARAAGIPHGADRIDCGLSLTNEDGKHTSLPQWNPLDDDGDALRLAVKLELEIYYGDDEGGTTVCVGYTTAAHAESAEMVAYKIELVEADPYAATRRAIVRAAAEIGKQMEVTK